MNGARVTGRWDEGRWGEEAEVQQQKKKKTKKKADVDGCDFLVRRVLASNPRLPGSQADVSGLDSCRGSPDHPRADSSIRCCILCCIL